MSAKKSTAIGIILAWVVLFIWAVVKDFDNEILVVFAMLATVSIFSSSLVLFGNKAKKCNAKEKNI